MIASMRALLVVLAAAALLAGCGGDAPEDNAVEATEQNTVELAGARYRVVLFRQLGAGAPPDDALWKGDPPAAGSAADRTFDGGVLVFEVPFDSTAERPMVLELGDPAGSGTARIQLDL